MVQGQKARLCCGTVSIEARYNWKTLRPEGRAVDELCEKLDVSKAIASALWARGIDGLKDAQAYLKPRLVNLSDPFDLPDMDNAVHCLWGCIDAGKKITIFGDYDVDGLTATALLYQVLRKFGAECSYFLPHREEEGYGLSGSAVERCLAEHSFQTLVTVDCGSCAGEQAGILRSRGKDVVVTDHHEFHEPCSQATAFVNPKRSSNPETRYLSGVGVAFKLCHAMQKRAMEQGRKVAGELDLRDFLDLVAVGTVADIVPLTGENRILVKAGIDRMKVSPSPGLAELVKVSQISGCRNSYDIGFRLGPRLNAAGRTGDATRALRLLLASDAVAARPFAEELNNANSMRRKIEERVGCEAQDKVESCFDPGTDFAVVVNGTDWPVGVIGIVASRLSGRHNRPAVIFSDDGQVTCRGSARRPDGMDFSLIEALSECGDLLEAYGGHQAAAGLEIKKDRIADFHAAFNEVCRRRLNGKDLTPGVIVTAWMKEPDFSLTMVDEVDKLRPFGAGNEGPLWGVKNALVVGAPRIVGKNHLKLSLRVGRSVIDAIGFRMGDRVPLEGDALDALFELEVNEWKGRRNLQMKLKDIRQSSP